MATQVELWNWIFQLIEHTNNTLVNQVGRVAWQGVVAVSGNVESGCAKSDFDSVPDIQGHTQTIEAWAHIG